MSRLDPATTPQEPPKPDPTDAEKDETSTWTPEQDDAVRGGDWRWA